MLFLSAVLNINDRAPYGVEHFKTSMKNEFEINLKTNLRFCF